MTKQKVNGTPEGAKAPRTRKSSKRVPLAPLAGEDISLQDLTFSPRSFYDSELDKLGLAHQSGKGRKYADDPRIKNSLRKRARARGWELEFLHIDLDGKPALIARISRIAGTPKMVDLAANTGGKILDQALWGNQGHSNVGTDPAV